MDVSVLLTGAFMALSLIIFVLVIAFIYTKNNISGKFLLQIFLTAELIYVFGYTCELTSNVVSQKLFFNHFMYIGLSFIAPLWYLISIQFANIKNKWMKLKYLIFIIPVIVLIGNFTHLSNHYYYKSYIPSNTNYGLFIIKYEKGFLYFINNAFQSILAVLSAVNYYNVFKKSIGALKKQAAILMGLSTFGFFIAVSCIFTRYTTNFDCGAGFIGVSAFILLITLFKYEFHDLLPLAYVKVFESNDNPIIILNDAKVIVKCNSAAMTVFGDRLKNHRKITDVFADEPELLESLANDKSCVIKRTVKEMQMYYSSKLIKLDKKNDEDVNEYGYLLTFTNVTEHVKEVHMLENAASVDPLTGVYNRRYFFAKANIAMENASENAGIFSLVMLDVDKFKKINDSFGHLAGDFVLKMVCNIIKKQLNENDITARYEIGRAHV
jgi:hypothetical protein